METIASVSAGRTVFITVLEGSGSTPLPPTDTIVSQNHSGGHAKISAIAGGIVGGLVLLTAVLYLLLMLRRKQHEKNDRRATLPPTYLADTVHGDMSEQLPSSPYLKSTSYT